MYVAVGFTATRMRGILQPCRISLGCVSKKPYLSFKTYCDSGPIFVYTTTCVFSVQIYHTSVYYKMSILHCTYVQFILGRTKVARYATIQIIQYLRLASSVLGSDESLLSQLIIHLGVVYGCVEPERLYFFPKMRLIKVIIYLHYA